MAVDCAASISLRRSPALDYVLRLADLCLVHAQRLCEWSGHAPIIEEDIALSNMGLDLLGQARALLAHAAALEGAGHDEDQLAFLRDEQDFLNPALAELPLRKGGGDFADTVLRNWMLACWLEQMWLRLADSADGQLAAIAGKAVKEARYHVAHAADWVLRLGDGTEESNQRMRAAIERAWPYVAELFEDDAIDEAAAASGLGPRCSELRTPWMQRWSALLAEAGLPEPVASAFRSHGRRGRHTEHMGYLLAEMQVLQRGHPGARW